MFLPLHFSWNSRVWSFFSSILGTEAFFVRFLSFLRSVNETQVITHKKIEKHDGRVSLMYCFNFFRNQLWQHLISYNSFRNINMCLLEVVMCEKCTSNHSQSEGGSKKFEDLGGGVTNFRTGWLPIWGGYFCWRWSVPHYMPW